MPSAADPGGVPPSRWAGEHESQRRQQAKEARPRMNLQNIQSWVDLEIEQAQRRGEFDDLPGAGKPLKDVEKSDPDWWVKQMIEREKLDLSAALPTVMALRQERRTYPESLAGVSDEVVVRERLEDYNARVLEDRRKPVVGPNSPAIAARVDVEGMVEQWRELRAALARDGDHPAVPDAPLADSEPVVASSRGSSVTLLWIVALVVLAAALVWWAT